MLHSTDRRRRKNKHVQVVAQALSESWAIDVDAEVDEQFLQQMEKVLRRFRFLTTVFQCDITAIDPEGWQDLSYMHDLRSSQIVSTEVAVVLAVMDDDWWRQRLELLISIKVPAQKHHRSINEDFQVALSTSDLAFSVGLARSRTMKCKHM